VNNKRVETWVATPKEKIEMAKIKHTRKQKELLAFLGGNYSVEIIGLEPCIYRKLNNHCDIEVSGTCKKQSKMTVYVWDISDGTRVIETHRDIVRVEGLKTILDKIAAKYIGTEVKSQWPSMNF
jgi:hypothetical protein